MAKKWMQSAVKRPGALTAKAKAAGESPMEFARSHAHAPGRTGQQARFALIAQKEPIPEEKGGEDRGKERRSRIYKHESSRAHRERA